MTKFFSAVLYLSVVAAAFLAFAWPFVVSRDQDSVAFHVIAVTDLLVIFVSLAVLCALRLRAGSGNSAA